jgi:drug/metabolite transporter (DMT)-like permease
VGYLVLVGSITVFLLALFVLRRWTASATSYVLVLMPLVTVALAAWLLGEHLTPVFALGGLLVLVGVWVGAIAQPAPQR